MGQQDSEDPGLSLDVGEQHDLDISASLAPANGDGSTSVDNASDPQANGYSLNSGSSSGGSTPTTTLLPPNSHVTLSMSSGQNAVQVWATDPATGQYRQILGAGLPANTVVDWTQTDPASDNFYPHALDVRAVKPTDLAGAKFDLEVSVPSSTAGGNPQSVTRTALAEIAGAPPLAGVDANRDGQVDLAGGSDQTTADHPYSFWLNDNVDVNDTGTENNDVGDYDEADPKTHIQDRFQTVIHSPRDLEDWSHIRVSAPPGFDPTAPTSWMQIRFTAVSGAPGISTISVTPDQGANYLTDPAVAESIVGDFVNQPSPVIDAGDHPKPFPTSPSYTASRYWTQANGRYSKDFLFEGVRPGEGALTFEFLTGTDPSTAISAGVSAPIYLKLSPTTSFYETWQVGNGATSNTSPDPKKVSIPKQPTLFGQSPYSPSDGHTDDYVLLVHGWRMQPWEKVYFANTAYKRLFWQGYNGRFGTFDWPTEWTDTSTAGRLYPKAIYDPQNYDKSEEKAWNSAAGLKNLLLTLDSRYGYQHINMFAHSMGNIVASEALRQAGNTKVVHTYVASQAASVAGAYDASAPKTLFSDGWLPGADQHQADIYGAFPNGDGTSSPYFASINSAADHIYNFFNPLDYATNTGSVAGFYVSWRANQSTKPDATDFDASREQSLDHPGSYNYVDGQWERGYWKEWTDSFGKQLAWVKLSTLDLSNPSDRYEAFSYAAQAQTLALGAQAGIAGPFTGEVNMNSDPYNYSDAPYDHSAQFMNTNARRASYWDVLLTKCEIPHGHET